MDIFVGVIVGLLVLMALVTAHEFGHFIAARKNGVNVLEFGICFPPRLAAWVKDPKTKKWHHLPRSEWKKPQKGLVFSLNLLPIGGFCQMDGESANDSRKGTFGNASFKAKTKILFAGVAMNWLIAWIILTVLAWTGMPTFINGQFTIDADTRTTASDYVTVTNVAKDSPAERAGFLAEDRVVKVAGQPIENATTITKYNSEHKGEEVVFEVERNCQETCESVTLAATLNPDGSEYLLGITMASEQTLSYSTWSAPIVGAGLTFQFTGETIKGIGDLFVKLVSGIAEQFSLDGSVRESGRAALSSASDSVSGPVGIIGQIFPAFTSAGPTNVAFLAAIISISLACMNVIPIPALDGGRWLLIAIFKLRKKELSKKTEEKIVSRAFIALLALIVLITILDVVRIIYGH